MRKEVCAGPWAHLDSAGGKVAELVLPPGETPQDTSTRYKVLAEIPTRKKMYCQWHCQWRGTAHPHSAHLPGTSRPFCCTHPPCSRTAWQMGALAVGGRPCSALARPAAAAARARARRARAPRPTGRLPCCSALSALGSSAAGAAPLPMLAPWRRRVARAQGQPRPCARALPGLPSARARPPLSLALCCPGTSAPAAGS